MWKPPVAPSNKGGRPLGSASALALEARTKAAETGELPHEFLLRVQRGDLIKAWVWDPVRGEKKMVWESADLATRIDAAKAAAPYFAPKLQSVEVISAVIGGANDADLDALIAELASQTATDLGASGEGETDTEGTRKTASRRRVRVTRP